jgi:pimeloyl-ACP methyl ester carboxylesterase
MVRREKFAAHNHRMPPHLSVETDRFRRGAQADVAYRYLPGRGDPVLLVHGVGADQATWQGIPRRLQEAGRAVLTIDLLGHGDSGAGGRDFGLSAHAALLRDLLDHLGVARVHLVGHSVGGGVSMQFAAESPERMSSLTLISSGGLGREVSVSLRAALLPGSSSSIGIITHRFVTNPMRQIIRFFEHRGLSNRDFNERTVDALERLQDGGRRTAFLETLRSVVGLNGQRLTVMDHLEVLDPQRLLIIWGDGDPMVPVIHGRTLHALLPGSRLVVIEGAGHEPYLDEPEIVIREVLAHTAPQLGVWAPTPELMTASEVTVRPL